MTHITEGNFLKIGKQKSKNGLWKDMECVVNSCYVVRQSSSAPLWPTEGVYLLGPLKSRVARRHRLRSLEQQRGRPFQAEASAGGAGSPVGVCAPRLATVQEVGVSLSRPPSPQPSTLGEDHRTQPLSPIPLLLTEGLL